MDANKQQGFFMVSRAGTDEAESDCTKSDEATKRSAFTSQRLGPVTVHDVPAEHEQASETKKSAKKKRSPFSRLFRRSEHASSDTRLSGNEREELNAMEKFHQKADLEFAHTLMNDPAEIATDLCRNDSEPDLVQTICSPNCFSKEAIRADKKIYQIDVANNRIATLSNLSGTAVLGKDYMALKFLHENLVRMRKQRSILFHELDKHLTRFKEDPNLIMSDSDSLSAVGHRRPSVTFSEENKVQFNIQNDEDETDELRWEINSISFSTENTSEESADEGPTPTEVEHLAKQVRKLEGTRFKHKRKIGLRKKHSTDESDNTLALPPPPNPLGHTNRALMRSHTTVPNGLCRQANASLPSFLKLTEEENVSRHRFQKRPSTANLPFNLLSLTGQLSWLVSEYVERGSSTYKWATDLIQQISRMSVTRSTWLNVHQQLRETTELLYKHRGKNVKLSVNCESAEGEVAWSHLRELHSSVLQGDSNSLTVTAGRANEILKGELETDRKLVHLSVLLQKKLQLAYICDLILWRAHKILFFKLGEAPEDTAQYQLIDFRIRHMQLRLDQANVQNWPPLVIDWMICWIYSAISPNQHVRKPEDDEFALDELSTFRTSIKRFQILTKHLCASEFLNDDFFLAPYSPCSPKSYRSESSNSLHRMPHHHYHPHLHHHGEGGNLQDLRPLDADRCCHKYSTLVRQVHEHAMAKRPLRYFAERALYDIAMELDCPVNWTQRLTDTLDELTKAYNEWEQLLMAKLDLDFYQTLFGSEATARYGREPS